MAADKNRRLLGLGLAGALIAAVMCFTPALVILLGVVGLSAWLGWADYVLLPALLLFASVAVFAFVRWTRQARSSERTASPPD
ncbi:MAG: mercury resistance system transport protein MerF [Alphaproteobacteria bacterium]